MINGDEVTGSMNCDLLKRKGLMLTGYIRSKSKPQKVAMYMLGGDDNLSLFVYRMNSVVVMKKHFMHILLGGHAHKEYRNH